MRLRNDGNIEYVAYRNRVLQLTPTIVGGAYSGAGVVLFETAEIKAIDPNAGPDSSGNGTLPAFSRPGGALLVQDIMLVDKAKQAATIDLYFFKSNVTIGAIDSAEALSDANAVELIGFVQLANANYLQLANVATVNPKNIGQILYADADASSLFVAAETQSTPTYGSTSDLRLMIKCRAF